MKGSAIRAPLTMESIVTKNLKCHEGASRGRSDGFSQISLSQSRHQPLHVYQRQLSRAFPPALASLRDLFEDDRFQLEVTWSNLLLKIRALMKCERIVIPNCIIQTQTKKCNILKYFVTISPKVPLWAIIYTNCYAYPQAQKARHFSLRASREREDPR